MRNLPYVIAALLALVASSSAFAATPEIGLDGSGGDPTGVEGAGAEDDEGLGGDDRSWTMGESEGGGCSLSELPPAGRNAALALLGLAFMSFGIRLAPRRRRARVSARR